MPYPKITWGPGFANTLYFGDAFDQALSYDNPRDGFKTALAGDGSETSWSLGRDSFIKGSLRYIPTADKTNPVRTGWDGVNGVKAWLADARASGVFRFYPDATQASYYACYLVEPRIGPAKLEVNGSKRLDVTFRTTDDSVVTAF